ncbi:carbohydrate ABC transporter permease [Paenibacillus nasutitermitis]|uniref:Sugar ABC transporter permease n=1 Tax=Paenibacillus nasutitermitis TaxID=1652958 RepID=A0A916YNN2_9BACL|nr:carbohydrate ABC transporter permease [Paenibacillus nasutitermitis]GGD54065.1 sugar ABC transporter permease [Paenibacillus nasutitermitis]
MSQLAAGTKRRLQTQSKRRSDLLLRSFIILALLAGSVLIIVPFVVMLSISLDQDAVFEFPFPFRLIPEHISLDNFRMAIANTNMMRLYVNTLMVAVGVIAISTFSALLAGYALSKLKVTGGNIILLLVLATLMIPGEATLIPLFMLFKQLHMINTYWAFYLPAISSVFGTFLAKQFMDSIPGELREAAIIDGANEFNCFTRIYFALSMPIVATLVILSFLGVWNSFLFPLIMLNDPAKYTIQLGIALLKSRTSSGEAPPGMNMAATVMSIIPVLLVYLFFQKYIIQSVAHTGIKQ